MTTEPDPRSITDAERPFLETLDDLGQMAELRRQIIAKGESPAMANGVVGWLLAKKVGDADTTGPAQRSNYRRILRDLTEEGRPTGTRANRRKGSGTAAAVASGLSMTFTAGVVVALYVTESPGDGELEAVGEALDQGDWLAPVRTLCATDAVDSAPDVRKVAA